MSVEVFVSSDILDGVYAIDKLEHTIDENGFSTKMSVYKPRVKAKAKAKGKGRASHKKQTQKQELAALNSDGSGDVWVALEGGGGFRNQTEYLRSETAGGYIFGVGAGLIPPEKAKVSASSSSIKWTHDNQGRAKAVSKDNLTKDGTATRATDAHKSKKGT
jgi:hypothetical protein